ncbi:hypothetical protein EDB81DRAFT_196114 [Dactylonectria macrodidyma]|uniref:Extracellular membrane protein CFEM domain-containing protein n=1 Tax=Dactylonectria macrodidyma TaxID=307937 RepID=A0A9P9JHI9_9HYPO|nr:hypothetical protein EDB81DRAFT_196114 [Dactylonectria macrodidyma]
MKSVPIGLALALGLAAVVTADTLPLEDIPLQCVQICGPIVELTTDCNVHARRLKKRLPDDHLVGRGEWVPKLAVEPLEEAVAARDDKEKRSFSIIVAAPTSFPVQVASSSALDLRPSSTITRITPTFDESLESSTQLLLSTSTTSTTSTTSLTSTTTSFATSTITAPPTSMSLSDQADSKTTTSTWDWDGNIQEPNGQLYSADNAEEDCVCLNESFDVGKLTALCASCIVSAGFPDNNINIIKDVCNFTDLTYTPSLDSVANNIQVKAVLPSSVGSTGAITYSSPVRIASALAGLVLALTLL